jgi:hypothetical protein
MLAALTLAGPVFAVDIIDDPMQIDERAAQLIQTSNSLCWEMHRFHQQQPDYRQSYRAAKEIWSRAGELREALRARPVETEALMRQITEMNEMFAQVEKTVSKWGTGDRSFVAPNNGPQQRLVVTPGAEIDIPFVGGVRVGRPQVVVADDGPPQLERRRLHPNSHGSKRSLERELAAVKVALSYLLEDATVNMEPNSDASGAPAATNAVPQAPAPDAALGDPQNIIPPSTKKPGAGSIRN